MRAIAVVAVVGGHVGLPGFGGGFTGVDIFFVISGFLIIGQIVAGLQAGTFTFAGFWAKRAFRIAPPMLVMLAASSVAAPFVFVVPSQYKEYGKELIYSALMLVNYYFLDRQNYFDTEAILKPLLHMWSLAVEEQFYLVTPLLLYGAWVARFSVGRQRNQVLGAAVILAFAVSFLGCILFTQSPKNPGFYATPFRVWEFIAGGAIWYFLPLTMGLSGRALGMVTWAGLAAILTAIVTYSEAEAYPSYLAIMPVAGSFLLILAGAARPGIGTTRFLAWPPLVWIGLVSYAWYLWHWPLLSFVRIYNFGQPGLARDGIAAVVALFLAIGSYWLIERPILRLRRAKLESRKNWRFVGLALVGCAIIALTGVAYQTAITKAMEAAIPESMRPDKDVKVTAGDECWMKSPDALSDRCIAKIGSGRAALLIGDSHARMLYPALRPRLATGGMELITLWHGGCGPFVDEGGSDPLGFDGLCENFFQRGLETLKAALKQPAKLAIVSGYWPLYYYGEPYSDFVGRDAGNSPQDEEERARHFSVALAGLIRALDGIGVEHIVLVGPTAEFVYHPVDCVLRTVRLGIARDFCAVKRAALDVWLAPVNVALDRSARVSARVQVIDTLGAACGAGICRPDRGETLWYTDENHVSAAGAAEVVDKTGLDAVIAPRGSSRN